MKSCLGLLPKIIKNMWIGVTLPVWNTALACLGISTHGCYYISYKNLMGAKQCFGRSLSKIHGCHLIRTQTCAPILTILACTVFDGRMSRFKICTDGNETKTATSRASLTQESSVLRYLATKTFYWDYFWPWQITLWSLITSLVCIV